MIPAVIPNMSNSAIPLNMSRFSTTVALLTYAILFLVSPSSNFFTPVFVLFVIALTTTASAVRQNAILTPHCICCNLILWRQVEVIPKLKLSHDHSSYLLCWSFGTLTYRSRMEFDRHTSVVQTLCFLFPAKALCHLLAAFPGYSSRSVIHFSTFPSHNQFFYRWSFLCYLVDFFLDDFLLSSPGQLHIFF